ncbi:MAG: HEPN domain-containing protein, partial [Armatimonadia bacterium]
DTVCFHAQQAVEKSLKALLAMHDVDYPLTHNVQWLLRLVGEFHPHLNEFTEPLEAFELYAVPVRYDEMLTPGLAEARELLAIAHEVYSAAKREIDIAGG